MSHGRNNSLFLGDFLYSYFGIFILIEKEIVMNDNKIRKLAYNPSLFSSRIVLSKYSLSISMLVREG